MIFKNLVGQKKVKEKLNFYLKVYDKKRSLPFLNFVGARGLGKTSFCKEVGNYLKKSNGEKKKFMEINSSTIKSVSSFFDEIYYDHIENKEIIILFDEMHALPQCLVYAFLTLLNTDRGFIRNYNMGGQQFRFDFQKQHFLFATTESHMIFPPLKDRLTSVELVDYNLDDIKEIFKNFLPDYSFDESALNIIAETSRGSARSCVLRARELDDYCQTYDIKHVKKEHVFKLLNILDILPHGLTSIEWQILNILKKEKGCTLTTLSAKTGLSASAIRKDHELFLLRKGFLVIEGARKITLKGRKVLEKQFT